MSGHRDLTIIQLNDSHGYFDLHPELFWAGDHADYRPAGGYARIATVLNQTRRKKPGAVLAFDCGDTIHGTHAAVTDEGEGMVPILNALQFDAMTSHWEFAYGPARFKQLAGQLHYPMLAINCYDKATGGLYFPPYTVLEAGGLRVGVVGIACNIVDKTMPPSFSEGVRFTLGREELPGHLETLRREEKVDLTIVVSHLGFPQEMKLAGEVPGIDVLLSGHTHNRLYKPARVGDTILIQSGCHGSFLGRLDLEVDGGRIVDFQHRLITLEEEVEPDPEVQGLVDRALAPDREEMSQVVGQTATALNRNTVLEATMDNFLLQSLLDLTGAELAFSNGWRYGAPILPGPITLNDLWNIIPVNPPVSTVEMTGEELWNMLEENLERTFAPDPYEQMGGYVKRCLGLNLYFKMENHRGHRIQELFIRGKRVDPDGVYSAAYVTQQGVPQKYGTNHKQLDVSAIEVMRRYLGRVDAVDAELRGTVVAV